MGQIRLFALFSFLIRNSSAANVGEDKKTISLEEEKEANIQGRLENLGTYKGWTVNCREHKNHSKCEEGQKIELIKGDRDCGREGEKDPKTSENLALFVLVNTHVDTEHKDIYPTNSRPRC